MTSLFRSNSVQRNQTDYRQKHQEIMARPKSPFGDLNFLPGRKTSKVVEPYARPSTAEPYYNNPLDYKSFRRNDMQNADRDCVLYNLAQRPTTRSRSDTGETIYVGLSVNTTYHKASAFCGTGFSQKPYEPFSPIDEEVPVARPRKDSLFSPHSGNNSRENSPKRGTPPPRQQHMMPPAVIGRPKLNRWKSLAGVFGKKSAPAVSGPQTVARTQSMFDLKSFTQSKSSEPGHTRSESRATVKDNPLRSNPINASVLAFRKVVSSPKPEAPLPDCDLPMETIEAVEPVPMPVIDIEIPTSRLERYSVMFEGIDLKRRESLRERRLSGGHTKAAIVKPLKLKTPDRAPRTPARRARANSHARSSSQSSIKSARLSLFPSGNTNTSTQSLHRRQPTPTRPATLRRTVTAPGDALSPLEPPPVIGRLSINTNSRPRSASRSSDRRPSTSDRRPSTSHSIDFLASASPADLSPVTPTHEMDPAAMYIASRKAAPWEHRRMSKATPTPTTTALSTNPPKLHTRSDSSGSEYSVDMPLVAGKNFTHSTIIEESVDTEDWQHRNAQVSVARSLSVTRAGSNAVRTQQPRLVPVQPGLQPVLMQGHRRNVQSVSGVVEGR